MSRGKYRIFSQSKVHIPEFRICFTIRVQHLTTVWGRTNRNKYINKIKKLTNHLWKERIDASEVALLESAVMELINLAMKNFLLRVEQAHERRRRTG